MDSNIYKDAYEVEEKQRAHLASTINIPIVASTAVGGALVTVVLQYPYQQELPTFLFVGFVAACLVALILAVGFIFCALIGYTNQKLASPGKLQEAYDALVAWHNSHASDEEAAKREFNINYREALADAIEVNRANNNMRGAYTFRANLSLSFAVLFLAAAGGIFVYASLQQGDKIHSIRIVQ